MGFSTYLESPVNNAPAQAAQTLEGTGAAPSTVCPPGARESP